jgi:hypothetical protein
MIDHKKKKLKNKRKLLELYKSCTKIMQETLLLTI